MRKFLTNGILGTIVGILSTYISLFNVNNCQEDCPNYIFFRAIGFIVIPLAIYLTFSLKYFQGKLTTLRITAFFLFVLVATVINMQDIAKNISYLEDRASVTTNFDFMYMSILTKKNVITYSNKEKNRQPINLEQWEKCAIDGAYCENEKLAHMKCKSGIVYVKEEDWDKFELIPKENIKGAEPLKSMKLCKKE